MQVYADKKGIKYLENSCQGPIEAIQDIENHVIGKNWGRVHEEENGMVLCQADTQRMTWQSANRFVYGMDSQKYKALFIDRVENHQQSQKARDNYNKVKACAVKTTDADFQNKNYLSSKDFLQQSKDNADRLIKPKKLSRIETLEKTYRECMEELKEEGTEFFKEVLREHIKQDGILSNSEQKKLQRKPKTDPFRIVVEKTLLMHSVE